MDSEISPLVFRTAEAIYMEGQTFGGFPSFDKLDKKSQSTYFRMAKAALTEAYREPVPEPVG